MWNRVCKTLSLAIAVSLLTAGSALAQQFSVSPATISNIGAGETVTVEVQVSELTEEIRSVVWFVSLEPVAAFDVAGTAAAGQYSGPAGGWLGSDAFGATVDGNRLELASAALAGDPIVGSGSLGTLDVIMAADYDGSEARVIIDSVKVAETVGGGYGAEATVFEQNSVVTNPPGPPPTIMGIDPDSGPLAGGIPVTISGADFVAAAEVMIGGVAATDVVVVDGETVTATVPPGDAGSVDVVVVNPDGQEAVLVDGFTYLEVVQPILVASTAQDFSLDFSAPGQGDVLDGSAGEATLGVMFHGASGVAEEGQVIEFAVWNIGEETVFIVAPGVMEVPAGETVTVAVATDGDGEASIVVDCEGDRLASTTSVIVNATTSAEDSEGVEHDLAVQFSVMWDVPTVAELAALHGSVTTDATVILEWSVVSQTGNLGWEVFRSSDNVSFERVGDFIQGDGTSDEFITYRFHDETAPAAETLYYYLNQVDIHGNNNRSSVISVNMTDARVLPTSTALMQNFPNPFNPETTIQFDLDQEGLVTLRIYDLTGQLIRTLFAGQHFRPGRYESIWYGLNDTGNHVASGVYIYRLTTETSSHVKKMTLVR